MKKVSFFLLIGLMSFGDLFGQQWLYLPTTNNNRINIGDVDIVGDSITVEALITRRNFTSPLDANDIISKHTNGNDCSYLFRPTEFAIRTSSGFTSVANPITLCYDSTYHVAATYDGDSLKYFLNGVKVAAKHHTGSLFQNELITGIGNVTGALSFNEQFIGFLDEVRIWKVARTRQQIASHMYSLPQATSQPGLVAYYTFEGNYNNVQGNSAFDGVSSGTNVFNTQNLLFNGDVDKTNCTNVNPLVGDLNFAQTIYFTAPDSTSLPGTVLTSSSGTLSGFNFDGVGPDHPLFKSGVFFPVTDCQNHNLWVKFRHVASDPNGRNFGANIAKTTGQMFPGGPTMIGGFSGFLFQIEIFRDQNLTGNRANILGALFPTTVTVSSLETLAYPQGPHEWLCFQIQNPGSTGWNLNSINFTGSNPNSHPGFSSRPVEVTNGNQATYLPQFSENFPTGRDSIYSIALPIGSFGEFKMTANEVSRFQYGYEFTSYGYQGMSMAFGEGPILKDSVANEKCYKTGGSIYIKPSGLGPYTYTWNNGHTGQNLINATPGPYSVKVKDGNNCISQVLKTILPGPIFTNVLTQTLLSGDTVAVLSTSITGGVSPLSYLWNTGSINDSLWTDSNGVYILTIKDADNCLAKDTITVSSFVGIEEALRENGILLYPNPNNGKALLRFSENASGSLRIIDLKGRQVWRKEFNRSNHQIEMDLQAIPAGVYTLFFESKGSSRQLRMVKE